MMITGDTVISKSYHPAQNSTVADKTSVCTLIKSRRMLGDTQIFCEKRYSTAFKSININTNTQNTGRNFLCYIKQWPFKYLRSLDEN